MRGTSNVGTGEMAKSMFPTYLEAHREATRRNAAMDAESGIIAKVEQSPYGGYVVRSWPIDLLIEPGLQSIVNRRRPTYRSASLDTVC